ncbi:hypothetical protein HOD29_04225 [archaeon]|jgi:hypothetical protein|nr:hypothetical protein [archaeon]
MIRIKRNKYYFFKVKVFGRELEYSGKVLGVGDDDFKVRTDEGCLDFGLRDIVYVKEVKEPVRDEVVVVRRKIGKKGLRRERGPLF